MQLQLLALVIFPFLVILTTGNRTQANEQSFKIDYRNNGFLKDGKKFRYVSGSIHYFRSTEEQWEDLLQKCRLGGLNAITT